MRRDPAGSAGLSLIELIIAVAVGSLVLVGLASLVTQMTQSQLSGVRSGTIAGWSVASYSSMAKELEDSNVLAYPAADGAAVDAVLVCKNWARELGVAPGARLDPTAAASVVQFCVDPALPVAPETGHTLRRYENTGPGVVCPDPGVPVPCEAAPSGTWTSVAVIGVRLEKLSGHPMMFTRDDKIGGVRIRYAIGAQAATPGQPVPRFTPFDFSVVMQKSLSNP